MCVHVCTCNLVDLYDTSTIMERYNKYHIETIDFGTESQILPARYLSLKFAPHICFTVEEYLRFQTWSNETVSSNFHTINRSSRLSMKHYIPPFFMYYGLEKAKQQSAHIMYHFLLIFSNSFLCSINWLNCQAFQTVALSRNINEE